MAERRKSSLPSQIGPSGNRIPGGGDFHPQQMLNQQFGYTAKLQAPPGLHGPFMVSYGQQQQPVFPPQQQGPYPHHASSYQQQHPHQQQQQQFQQQQQHLQFMQQHDNVHSMQFMQDAQKSSSSQSQPNIKSPDQEAKDGESSSSRPSPAIVKQDNSTDGGSAKDDSEASEAKKELEVIRAAHEKQVKELEERIKALEEQKTVKEVKYLRVPGGAQKKSQQKRALETEEEEVGNIFEGPAEESDLLDRCPSPAMSVHSNISIKEEPEDDFEDKVPWNIQRKSKPKPPKVEVDEASIDKEIPKSDPENTKPPKAYTLSVTDFDMCIFCQTKSEKKMAYVTEDHLVDMQILVLNVDCEASQRLKDYIFDIDMFLNNIPQYHSPCLHKLMGKLRKQRKIAKNTDETDLSLCMFCQEHRSESSYDFTNQGIANLLSDLNKFDDEKIEKFKIFFNFDRIKNIVEVESAKEEFSPEKFMYHKFCKNKFIFRNRIRKKLKTTTSEPENMEENVEITPDEEIFELIAKKKKKIEEDKKKKQRKILSEPKDFNYKRKCVFCGGANNSKNGNRVRPIKDHNIAKSKDKAEKKQHSDIIQIMEHGIEHGFDLLCHDKCYNNYNYNYEKKNYCKKGTRDHIYETAFEAIITEIEDPMFRNGKVFSLLELRENYLKILKEFEIESIVHLSIFANKIKSYYTFDKKCRVNVIPFPDNFIYSKHLSESQVAPQIIILRAYKKNEKKVKTLSEDLADSNNGSSSGERKKKLRFSCTECDYKCNLQRSLIKHKRKHEEVGLTKIMCEVCGQMLNSKETLKTHMRKHSGDKYYCLKCDKSYVSKTALDNHALTHTGEKKEECPQCGKRFLLKKYVKHHLKMVHEPKSTEKPFLCNICGNCFRTRDGLKEHAVKHTDEKPFLCKECGKAFKYRSVRRVHMLAHEGRKPQMCSLCSFGCYTKGQLEQHMASHSGSKEHIMSYNIEKEDVKSVLERYINLDEIPNVKSQTYFPL